MQRGVVVEIGEQMLAVRPVRDDGSPGEILDGGVFNCPGKSGRTSFRLLHVFEFKDGRISREQAWLDLAAIQHQLGAAPR